jgi:hypothetical protein
MRSDGFVLMNNPMSLQLETDMRPAPLEATRDCLASE